MIQFRLVGIFIKDVTLYFLNNLAARYATGIFDMHCLVTAATAFEISPFIESYRQNAGASNGELTIDILVTGIGMVACTHAITKHLSIRKPSLIIQAGIAGCFDKDLPLGTVVAVRQECIAELGVMEKDQWKTIFDLGLAKPAHFPYSKGWLVNRSVILKELTLPKVNGISVNEITTSPKKIKMYRDLFRPVTESLEGAAVHYVAISENIPFLQVRAFSNYIGERDKNKWELNRSIHNLNQELIKIIKTLNT